MVAPAINPTLNLDDMLHSRGIADACNNAEWTPHTYKGFQGWKYPVFNMAGQQYTSERGLVWRWKNAEPQTDAKSGWQKYAWIPSKPERARYYLLPDTLQAIKDKNGVLYIASGEPDVMAYRAAGIRNVLCWFDGEKSIPATLLSDLDLMQARVVNIYPDRDNTGMEAAALLLKLFEDSAFKFYVWRLPGEIGSKHDVNWLWQSVGFNPEVFKNALYDAKPLDPDTLHLYSQNDAPKPVSAQYFEHSGDMPQGFIDAMVNHVAQRDGFKHWKSDGWANYKCDLHEDTTASAGFNRETMAFNCFVCGSMNAKDYGEKVGIHLRDYYPKQPLTLFPVSTHTPTQQPVRNDDAPLFEVGSKVGLEIIEELRGERVPDVEPIEFPLRSLHRFGGFAKMMWPGKLVYIAGVSGGGKTSMGETISEVLQQDGHDVIWYNPEWSAREMRIRALQRQGGLHMTRYAEMTLGNIDRKNGVALPRGTALSKHEQDDNINRMQRILSWPGDVYTLSQDARLNSMEAILATAEGIVTQMRASGRKVSAFFFDYIQRAPKAKVTGWDSQEWVVSQIKSFCERMKLFGFVFVQPTKGDSKSTRNGTSLTEASGQGLSDQQANLYITMTPAYGSDGDKRPYTKLQIVKNSMGMSGKINLKWAYHTLTVVDEEITEAYIKAQGWDDSDKDGEE